MVALATHLHRLSTDPLYCYEHGRPGHGGMAAYQRACARSQAPNRLLVAGNRMGKTFHAAAEAWWHMLGKHPFRPSRQGTLGWALGVDLKSWWPAFSRCLRLLEPPGVIDPRTAYSDDDGYTVPTTTGRIKGLRVSAAHGGGRLIAKGCDQSVLALESAEVDWGLIDEPPKRAHWNALRSRLVTTLGPLLVTLTPVGRPCGWIRDIAEGDPEQNTGPLEQDWYSDHVEVTKSNAPHRSAASITKQRAECDPAEAPQRIYAKWEGVAIGRRMRSFTEGCLFTDEDMRGLTPEELLVGLDHGEGTGKECGYLIATIGRRWWVLAEHVGGGAGGFLPRQTAIGVQALLEGVGASPYHVTECHGDTNSAGLLGAGQKFNALVEAEIASVYGAARSPIDVLPASKGRGSVGAGEGALNHALAEGRLLIHVSCRRLIHSMRYYTGTEKDLKDPLDAVRYGLGSRLLSLSTTTARPEIVL